MKRKLKEPEKHLWSPCVEEVVKFESSMQFITESTPTIQQRIHQQDIRHFHTPHKCAGNGCNVVLVVEYMDVVH